MTEQLTLDLDLPGRTWGQVKPGDLVPQHQATWHPKHGLGSRTIQMRVTRVVDRGDGRVSVEMVGLSGAIHVRLFHYRADEAVAS